ncbi:putative enoyl-CoA hydratase echA8 [Variibacter gotjawalensis]|uniref:3-hydroxyisobutyryl-CoA hydrolase n=1 Tax=Variibacter gotjawalensis TaxID=1333996 RepID=A0A0S3PXB3_9BRAD|nr:enoyl-CoA hydratase/isomerase family protein [Variibacter gotjawalensis]NIK46411.1 enoyl-CoA hydratase [Variibacter gotjawalensis]RZS48321.1 enoyl-CoA hydratase [Variibacter gotjawalensis]BAT60581.1 putative enoyl-CoA hydratase echA8 [Variibacter gotjawalensis]
MPENAEILFEKRGEAGVVTLNRPQALNAVTLSMVHALTNALQSWVNDASVTRVIVKAEGGKAFSAGGDIRALWESGKAGRFDEMLTFWRDEYALNSYIKHYPKPYVSLIDGIVMGGGVGVSVHGSHRVAGDRYLFAMPEVGIGFFPDVGATFFLPRMPGETGTYCGLTGDRVKTADAVATGLATHHVPSSRWIDLFDALCGSDDVNTTLARFAQTADGAGPVVTQRKTIDTCFAKDSVEEIFDSLDADGSEFALATAKGIRAKSPTALKIALRQVRDGAGASLNECLNIEYRIVSRLIHQNDFYEGVRAAIIDKDQMPVWVPETLDSVGDVGAFFASLGDKELGLP